jgi:hypothetical protein
MSTSPQPEFKSGQYEFNAEQNRTIGELASAMSVVATLMKVAGLVFMVFFALVLYPAILAKLPLSGYAPVVGLGAAALLCLSIGFWTSGSAHSFQRIVESQNRDIWHLMNALSALRDMYGLLRTIIIGALVLAAVGAALSLFQGGSGG